MGLSIRHIFLQRFYLSVNHSAPIDLFLAVVGSGSEKPAFEIVDGGGNGVKVTIVEQLRGPMIIRGGAL